MYFMSGIVKKGSEDFLYLYQRNIIILYAREDYTFNLTSISLKSYLINCDVLERVHVLGRNYMCKDIVNFRLPIPCSA